MIADRLVVIGCLVVTACQPARERDCERVHLVLDFAQLYAYAPTREHDPVERFRHLELRDAAVTSLVREAIENPALDPNAWASMYTPYVTPAVPSFQDRLAALCPR